MNNNLEYVHCDLCGANDYIKVTSQTDLLHCTTKNYFDIVQCSKCGLCYTNPRPTKEAISKYYTAKYSFHSNQNKIKMWAVAFLRKIANSRLGWIINFMPVKNRKKIALIYPILKDPVKEFIRKKKRKVIFLDIGTGSGVTANYWGFEGSIQRYKKYADVYGVEIDNEARAILSSYNINAYRNINELPPDFKYDVIRLNWSLEHVFSPSYYFEFIKRSLKKDGIAIICVPNYDGIIYRIDKSCVELPIHFYHFNESTMRKYAEKYELNIKKVITFSYPSMFVNAGEVGIDSFSLLKEMTYREARSFQKILNKMSIKELGNDMIVVLDI